MKRMVGELTDAFTTNPRCSASVRRGRSPLSTVVVLSLPLLLLRPHGALAQDVLPRLLRVLSSDSARVAVGGQAANLRVGRHLDNWTLMHVFPASSSLQSPPQVVLEDFTRFGGRLLVVDVHGVRLNLSKTAEPTSTDSIRYYLGHTPEEVLRSPTDMMGDQLLAGGRDPTYEEVATALPPITRQMATYGFVGTPDSRDKIGFDYGGRTANFDPAPYDTMIRVIRDQGKVLDGLVGGDLPVMRFVYPESQHAWCEMVAFAPFRHVNSSASVQPVWYRLARVDSDTLRWVQYVDSYHPFPPRTHDDPALFWRDLVQLHAGWKRLMAGAMQVQLPDGRLADMARFGLVREIMTRTGDFPHYGVVDRNYGGSEHDGFPDAFTVATEAMLDWGMVARAGRYIDNYFSQYVRDDGSLLYRGPETGQYGRMLTVLAQYIDDGGDGALLLKHRRRIDAVTHLLLYLRSRAKALPADSPTYGMIAGWSEADAALDPDPPRYMQPYFSNSTEAARGFADLGRVWKRLGRERRDAALQAWGERLVHEAQELQRDIQQAIGRSVLRRDGETILPAIAGVPEPFHVAVQRDGSDPQFRSYRAHMEMLHSGNLTRQQVTWIVNYRARHHDQILGLPTAYGYDTGELADFLSYGNGFGLIQHDFVPEALLLLWADMAHGHTRGGWTAPETRSILPGNVIAPYATPAQLVVPLMTRWLLVFEDPQADTVWLGKALPREWLGQGRRVSVKAAPTRFGRVTFGIRSFIDDGRVEADVLTPPHFAAVTQLRLRVPGGRVLVSARVNGRPWTHLDPGQQVITLPPASLGQGGATKVIGFFR
jgi:hypothetical protein